MKIALTADPFIAVPPVLYGGIERIVASLITEYVAAGHEVSLFAHPESRTEAQLFPYPATGNSCKDVLKNARLIWREMRHGEYDVLHSFGRMAYMVPQLQGKIVKIMSYQREPTIKQVRRILGLARSGSLHFTGCSDYISNKIAPFAQCTTIYNCAEAAKYQFCADVPPDAPLFFLGRLEHIKGVHLAIEIAQRTSRRLIIAGNVPAGQEPYFQAMIKPHLNQEINYIGAVTDEQKNQLLGNALALVFPIQWDEPFGIVMAEAMACGTPVIGMSRGAVPEIISNGENGFCADHIDDLIASVKRLNSISRKTVRATFEQRFSEGVIARQYLRLYRNLLKI